MNKADRILKNISIVLGAISALFFVYSAIVFARMMPKLTAFMPITASEENLFLGVGAGLLIYLIFISLSVLRAASYTRYAEGVPLVAAGLIVLGVLAFIFVFSDLALLSDIGKQYTAGFEQPEWTILFILMAFQLIVLVVFMHQHFRGFKETGKCEPPARDSNLFMIVQYVGALCGLMGLALSSLGFFYPRAWKLEGHTLFTVMILMIPYTLAAVYWLAAKLREKPRQLYDEKQMLDVGRSALITTLTSTIQMLSLFTLNFRGLGDMVSVLWLPLYLFSALLVFSCTNIYFALKVK